MAELRYIRMKELIKITGLSQGTIVRHEQAGTFPRRRRLSVSAVGWLSSEIAEWMENRAAVKSADQAT